MLQFDCPGILQDPNLETLQESINTLIDGGRVIQLKDIEDKSINTKQTPMGLGQWLLLSGVQQINNEVEELKFISLDNMKDLIQNNSEFFIGSNKSYYKCVMEAINTSI